MDTWLTFDQQSVDNSPSVDQLICIDQIIRLNVV